MKALGSMVVLGVAVIGLAGCLSSSDAAAPACSSGDVEIKSDSKVVNDVNTIKQIKVLADQAGYEAELANYTSDAPATLDFSKGRVLLVDMGQRSSSGYAVGVTSTQDRGEYVEATVTSTVPGSGCVVAAAITNPYQFFYVASSKEILVVEEYKVENCAT